MIVQRLKEISDIFSQFETIIFVESNRFFCSTNNSEHQNFVKLCETNKIPIEETGNDYIIKVKSFLEGATVVTYEDAEKHLHSEALSKPFVILNKNGEFFYHDRPKGETEWSTNRSRGFEVFCVNITAYYVLYNYFKSPEFADHHNDANKEIVLYSAVNGIFKIKYLPQPIIERTEDTKPHIKKILEISEPVQLRPYVKNALFKIAENKTKLSLNEIIVNAAKIVEIAQNDYDIASKNFDFKKFRDTLTKEKENYFSGINDVLAKIFSQAVGIPISISTTVFATYKVEDDILMLLIILLAFALYIIFYVKIQYVYRADLVEIKHGFQHDFEIIKAESGLPEIEVNIEIGKIERKIRNSLSMIDWLIGIVAGLGFLVIIYIIYIIFTAQIIWILQNIRAVIFFLYSMNITP